MVYKGKTLLSKVDPAARAEKIIAGLTLREKTLYLCPSPIHGHGLELLSKRLKEAFPENSSAILCVEAEAELYEISKSSLPEIFHHQNNSLIKIFFSDASLVSAGSLAKAGMPASAASAAAASSIEDLLSFFRKTWGKRDFRRIECLKLTGGWQLHPGLYDELEKTLGNEIALNWGNAMTLIKLGRLYIKNLIRNIPLLANACDLKHLDYGSSPLLVLGAGPSLDKTLNDLSHYSGGKIKPPGERPYKIICVDTCLPILHERDIVPDLVVILESQHWNLRAFSGARDRNIDAAIDLSSLPSSTTVLKGKNNLFFTPWSEIRLFERLDAAGFLPLTIPPLGSVGLSAVFIALRCTRGKVFTAGLDFSFSLDTYHARSSPSQDELDRKQNRFKSKLNIAASFREGCFQTLSKMGTMVRSDPALRNYRDLFEQEFAASGIIDIDSPGLPLGVQTHSAEKAFALLNTGAATGTPGSTANMAAAAPDSTDSRIAPPASMANIGKIDNSSSLQSKEKIATFINLELSLLKNLRAILSGGTYAGEMPIDYSLEDLLDKLDYLWAHFPDCAGAGGKHPGTNDLSFLKRVRTEIDPFIKLWEMALWSPQLL